VSPWLAAAAALGALGVGLGAFGAHGLRALVPERDLATWETAVLYHQLHALALLALALFGAATRRDVRLPAILFALGIALFSGSLYGLVLGGARWLGAVTPFGGLCFVVGWLALLRLRRPG
jgi:uncharacterized membrane protein YgdD (TMEM256/DUF423 family)